MKKIMCVIRKDNIMEFNFDIRYRNGDEMDVIHNTEVFRQMPYLLLKMRNEMADRYAVNCCIIELVLYMTESDKPEEMLEEFIKYIKWRAEREYPPEDVEEIIRNMSWALRYCNETHTKIGEFVWEYAENRERFMDCCRMLDDGRKLIFLDDNINTAIS